MSGDEDDAVHAHPLMPGPDRVHEAYAPPPEPILSNPGPGAWPDPADPDSWPTIGVPDGVGPHIGAWARRAEES